MRIKQRDLFWMVAVNMQHMGLKWITGVSGGAKGPFQLLSVDGTGCLGWLVSYLPWRTNIYRGPAPFGTLKSFFPTSLGGSQGLEAWMPYGPSLFPTEFRPLGCPASKSTQENLTICDVTKAFWQLMVFITSTSMSFICIFQNFSGDCISRQKSINLGSFSWFYYISFLGYYLRIYITQKCL